MSVVGLGVQPVLPRHICSRLCLVRVPERRLREPVFSNTVHMFRGFQEPSRMLRLKKERPLVKHGYQITQGYQAKVV